MQANLLQLAWEVWWGETDRTRRCKAPRIQARCM